MSLIALTDLAIGYPRCPIAADISFTVEHGQALAVLGPNGSGKSTLFRTMLGLLAPLAGGVTLSGIPIASLAPAAIARQVAYVPQNAAGLFDFSVIDVVEMARAPYVGWFERPGAHDRLVTLNALNDVGMRDFAERSFVELSGGEQQLVLIARALASEARCLLLDEPTASLDYGNRILVLNALAALKTSGIAVIFTTHDPDHVALVCTNEADRVLTISRDGRCTIGSTASALNPTALAALYGIAKEHFDRSHFLQHATSK